MQVPAHLTLEARGVINLSNQKCLVGVCINLCGQDLYYCFYSDQLIDWNKICLAANIMAALDSCRII